MKKYSKMGKWAKIGLITGAIIGFGIAVYMRHSGFLMGKLVHTLNTVGTQYAII